MHDELGEIMARLEREERNKVRAARAAETRRKHRPRPDGSRGDATWATLRERKQTRKRY